MKKKKKTPEKKRKEIMKTPYALYIDSFPVIVMDEKRGRVTRSRKKVG